MAPFNFGTAARITCNGKFASNFSRAQHLRLTTPLQQSSLGPARRSINISLLKSSLSTTARRRQEPQNTINSTATRSTTIAPVQPAFWERLGLVSQFFRWYGRINSKRPYLTQFLSSLVIFCTGDLAAQYFGGEEYDYKRTLRILAISAGSSIAIFKWLVCASCSESSQISKY